MRKQSWLFILLLAVQIISAMTPSHAFAATSDGRTARRFGLYGSVLGDPAPSAVGLNLAFNMTNFLQLHAGAGGYSDWLGPNLGRAVSNYTLRPLAFAVCWPLVYIVTLTFGQIF